EEEGGVVCGCSCDLPRHYVARGGDHGDFSANQIGCQRRQPIELIFGGPPKLDRHALAYDIAGLAQAFAEPRDQRRKLFRRTMMEKSNDRHRRLLCARRERPGRRAAEQRDEIAPLHHSITSSARASSASGTVRPSTFAVLRLITSSNLVGC